MDAIQYTTDMDKIQLLSEEVINKIAAGEVIENPASVVKELIENSLDAGACSIEVQIEEGGLRLIRVEDDGVGMSQEDALLSVQRHATSKLREAEDIFSLSTMGFRGEALAAISAVSELEILTAQEEKGTRVFLEGGRWVFGPCARNRGTTVSVCSLFYNAPARRKFQKKPATLQGQVVQVIETIALGHPACHFSLKADGKTVLSLHPEEKRERIERVLGPFFAHVEKKGVWALLGAPHEAKQKRMSQKIFVNGRPVFAPLLSKAVQAGYGTRIAEGLYPPFVLFLELDPKTIDVNVHPQKKEIRFQDERQLFQRIEEVVSSAFSDPVTAFRSPLDFSSPSLSFRLEESPSFLHEDFQGDLSFSVVEKPLWVENSLFLFEKEGLYLVDLRRARSRLLFESFQKEVLDFQTLLFPLVIEADEEEEALFAKIPYTRVGKGEIAIEALPPLLEVEEALSFFSVWKREKELKRAALRHATTSQRSYSLEEALSIWRALQKEKESLFDPEGRPIWKKLKGEDLSPLIV